MIEVEDTPENRSPTALFSTIIGDSMSPVLETGWVVRIQTARIPQDGDVVAIYIEGEGGMVGYWTPPSALEKANVAYEPVDLTQKGPWRIVGVVEGVVSAPILPRGVSGYTA